MFLVVVVAFLSLLSLTSAYLMQGLLFYRYAVADQVQALVYDGYRDGMCAYAVAQLAPEIQALELLGLPIERPCTVWNTQAHGFIIGKIRYTREGPGITITVTVEKEGRIVRSARVQGVWQVLGKQGRFVCVRIDDF